MGPRNYFSVAGGRTSGAWAWSAGMVMDYANRPFVLRSCISGTNCDDPATSSDYDLDVVEHLLHFNFIGTLTPIPRVQIGLRFPLAYSTGDGLPSDLVAIDLKAAIDALGAITGDNAKIDVLDEIFSRFCVGK